MAKSNGVAMPAEAPVELGMGLKARLMRVGPAQAEDWLKKNCENNRRVVRSRVRQYAADMKSGRWRLSDQAVSFDNEGRLVNGQHRLMACLESGEEFLTLVVWGIPPESMLVLDGGKKRTTDDNMSLAGKDYPRGAGATVRRVMAGLDPRFQAGRTDQEVDDFLQKYGDSVAFAHHHLPKGKTATAPVRAALARAHACGNDPKRLEDFARVLATGLMVPGDEAAVCLRNFILEDLSLARGSDRKTLYAQAEAAVRHFIAGTAVRKLQPVKAEAFPLPDEGYWLED